ncbi:hypothetical protein ES703_24769 [subsurface metagenome]
MGTKYKIKKEGKVIYLKDKVGVCYPGGIHSLAERTGFDMDDLFQMLLNLCMSGLVLPTRLIGKDGREKPAWVLARNERDISKLRKVFMEGMDKCAEGIEGLEKTRDCIFGEMQDRVKDKG